MIAVMPVIPTLYSGASDIPLDLSVARRLPADLAYRHLALPLVAENGRITVLMVDPTDEVAVAAVAAALGHSPYLVRGDPTLMTALLLKVWPEPMPTLLRLLVATPPGSVAAPVRAYVQRLGNLLNSQIIYFPLSEQDDALTTLGQTAMTQADLVALDEPTRPWLSQLLHGSVAQEALRRIPTSLLFARQPRWPLRRLLLVLKGEVGEEIGLSWVLRLAKPAAAAVNLLLVVPGHTWLYNRESRAWQGAAALLGAETSLGQEAIQVAQQLAEAGIPGQLCMRQGPPTEQIRAEVMAGNYDLVVMCGRAAEVGWWSGELVAPTLRWLDRPLLLVRG